MPIYNEENTFLEIYNKVNNVKLEEIEKEIIIIDDCSTDSSWKIIQKIKDRNTIKIKHNKNTGKGGAIKTGLKYMTGDYMIIQDGDLEYNPEEYKKLLSEIKNYDIVYGSRFLGEIKGFKIPLHYIGNKILSFTTTIIYGKRITDMETCYKLIKSDIIRKIRIKSNRFDFEPEITAKLLKRKYRIKEIPISYNCRSFKEGKKITLKDGIKAMFILIKYKFTD